MFDEKGNITEATTSNIWIIKNKNKEKEIKIDSLIDVDGVFLTNSYSLLVMAKKIDKIKLNLDKDNIFSLLYNYLIKFIGVNDEKI